MIVVFILGKIILNIVSLQLSRISVLVISQDISNLSNADLAIKDNLLYADSYVDLVWFDITEPSRPVLRGRKT